MTDMQHHAALHEKAVQAVARDDLQPMTRRKYPARGRKRVLNEYSGQVPAAAMQAARRAMRPGQRLVIVSESEVLIVNR